MEPLHISLLVHFIGIGLVFTTLVGGWLVTGRYRRAPDWKSKALLAGALRPIGLLSPIAVLVMFASGFGNMAYLGYGVFTAPWLSTKLVFFLLLVIAGAISGARSMRRGKLITQMAEGSTDESTMQKIRALDRQLRWFSLLQALLLLIILLLSIVKPHAW